MDPVAPDTKETKETKRKRAKKPKVKTGCKTCKIRRVKCDETRPECLRCQKYGKGYCDGYDNLKPDPPETQPILPKTTALAKPALRGDPVIQVFSSQDEFRCFRTYCEEVAPQLSGSNRSMWHQLLLQAGQSQPFIRHAIIAMGALNRSLQDVGMGIVRIRGDSPPADELEHHEELTEKLSSFALDHYGKFLKGARGQISMSGKGQERRNAMIACLLVVCIENMQYHYANALMHAQFGFRLMDELVEHAPGPKQQNGMSSPIPTIVEDELVQQFHRMEMQVMVTYDSRTPEQHWRLKQDGTATIKNMPSTFTSAEQARLYIDLIMRRTFHFIASALAHRATYEESASLPTPAKTSSDGAPLFTVPHVDYHSWVRGVPEELQVEQEMYAAENRRWAKAFEPLHRTALRNINRPESIPILLMKVHSWTLTARLGGLLSTNELVFDNFHAEFEGIINYARILLNHPQGKRHFAGGAFSFDMGLIYPLMTPGLSCRDRKLRRECIELLKSHQWREGQWGSESSAIVATWLMEVEEEGVETDHIPQWARAKLSGMVADLENRRLTLHCVRGFGPGSVHMETVRECKEILV